MPKFKITDNQTGQTLVVSGDTPPTEQESQEIFSSYHNTATSKAVIGQRKQPLLHLGGESNTTYGGPPIQLASDPNLASDLFKEASRPSIAIPKFTINPTDSKTMAIGKEAVNILSSLPEFVESPVGIASLATGGVLPKTVGTIFTATSLQSAGKQVLQSHKDWASYTPAQKATAATDIAGNLTLAGLLGYGIKRSIMTDRVANSGAPATAAVLGDTLKMPEAVKPPTPKVEESPKKEPEKPKTPEPVKPEPVEPSTEWRPAIRLMPSELDEGSGGQVVEGDVGQSHNDIIKSKNIPADMIDQRGFVDPKGNWKTREEAAKETKLPTEVQEGRLHSSDLPEPKPEQPATAAPVSVSPQTAKAADITGETQPSVTPPVTETAKPKKPKSQEVTKQPIDTLNTAKQVSIKAPKDATMVRVTDKSGKTSVQDLKSIQGDNVFQGAGIKKIEAGTIGKDKKFIPVKGEVTVEDKTPQPISHGPGGMSYRSIAEAENAPIPKEPEAKLFGISQAARESLAAAGETPETLPGRGISRDKAIAEGERLLNEGFDAPRALRNFEKNGKVSPEALFAIRAYEERLFKQQQDAESKYGPASKEYQNAYQKFADWYRRSKGIATAAHKLMVGHQGVVDIDTGTVSGLARIYHDETGKTFTPEQTKTATKLAAEVKKAEKADAAANEALFKAVEPKDVASQKPLTKMAVEELKKSVAGRKGNDFSIEEVRAMWRMVRDKYNQTKNADFERLASQVADELGLFPEQVVRAMIQPKTIRRLAYDKWRAEADMRRVKADAEAWVRYNDSPLVAKLARLVHRKAFAAKTAWHGFVWGVTHTPIPMFAHPRIFLSEYLKTYQNVFSKGQHQAYLNFIRYHPNYDMWRKAGLENDVDRIVDEYTNPNPMLPKWLGRGSGNRGYDALKGIRLHLAENIWDGIDPKLQTESMARDIADWVNHSTGSLHPGASKGFFASVSRGLKSEPARVIGFAPALWGSRFATLSDLAKSPFDWFSKSPEERAIAVEIMKDGGRFLSVYGGLMAVNQAFLTISGSDQKVNFYDPTKADFMAFKTREGTGYGFVPGFAGLVKLGSRLAMSQVQRKGFQRTETNYQTGTEVLSGYARGQFSPWLGWFTDITTGTDFRGRPLPEYLNVPGIVGTQDIGTSRMQERKPQYTYVEFLGQEFTPIPISEAVRHYYSVAAENGLDESEAKKILKSIGAFAIAAGTGSRVIEPVEERK